MFYAKKSFVGKLNRKLWGTFVCKTSAELVLENWKISKSFLDYLKPFNVQKRLLMIIHELSKQVSSLNDRLTFISKKTIDLIKAFYSFFYLSPETV